MLYNPRGGRLTVDIDGNRSNIQLSGKRTGYRWVKIADSIKLNGDTPVTLINQDGFGSIAGIMAIPREMVDSYRDNVLGTWNIAYIDNNSKAGELDIPDSSPGCVINQNEYVEQFIPYIKIKGTCESNTLLQMSVFKSEFSYKDNITGKETYLRKVPVNKQFDGQIQFFSLLDVAIWVLYGLSIVAILIVGITGLLNYS